MSYAPWMAALGPQDEPDYHAYWQETESLADAMIDVATYDDWFPDIYSPIAAVQQCGGQKNCAECGEPQFMTLSGICCANGHGGAPSL